MILEGMRYARFITLKNNIDYNISPLVIDIFSHIHSDVDIAFYCYNRPAETWKKLLSAKDIIYYEYSDLKSMTPITKKTTVFIDSFNQLCLLYGVQHIFEQIKWVMLNPLVKIIVIYHTDCQWSFRTEYLLDHITQMMLTPLSISGISKLRTLMHCKKGSKLIKTVIDISYDDNSTLNYVSVSNEIVQNIDEVANQVTPHNITTFKIALDNKEKVARNKLELPYMNRLPTGQVHYELDAADDWDDEDPDDDLVI